MAGDPPIATPADRHYERTRHVWAHRNADSGRVRIGIDALALESLGELAYVALRATGSSVARGESVGTLEAAKMTSDIATPIAGKIVARNDVVLGDPLAVNREPYGGGWLLELEPSAWEDDAAELVTGSDVAEWAAGEAARIAAEGRLD